MHPIIILPRYYGDRIASCGKGYGIVDVRADERDAVFVVDGFNRGKDGGGLHGGSAFVESHSVAHAARQPRAVWYRAEPELHLVGFDSRRRAGALPLDDFRAGVGGWIGLSRNGAALALTFAELPDGELDWRAWVLSEAEGRAQLTDIQVVDETIDRLAPLAGHWPIDELADTHVVVVGAGSIGSHANDALAEYGIRQLTLVDPDRLLNHNFARHRAHPSQLGRLKVNAERDRLLNHDSRLNVDALPLDVIYDADAMRPLFERADLVVVTVDGIDPRRAANHLARRAGIPALFACVLENGAFGEIIRIPSRRVGCLLCARARLFEQGGMAPERTLDRGYGTGTRHLPMTAVGGDLGLVGQLAGKAAVATLLERKGYRDQRLPGDHMVIGLRPVPGMAPPFDVSEAGHVRWAQLAEPRPNCPTCGT